MEVEASHRRLLLLYLEGRNETWITITVIIPAIYMEFYSSQGTPQIFFFFFVAALGLCCCTQAFSSCGEWGLLFLVVQSLLITVASLVTEHRL